MSLILNFFFLAILKESDGRKRLEENIARLRKDQKGLLLRGFRAKTFQIWGLFSEVKLKLISETREMFFLPNPCAQMSFFPRGGVNILGDMEYKLSKLP